MKKFEHKNKDERRRVLLSKNNELSYTFDNDKLPEENQAVQANGVGVMAKLGALTRKQLRALVAIIVAVCVVVPTMLFVGLHGKADNNTVARVTIDGLETNKEVELVNEEEGRYRVKLEAYNSAEFLTQPTNDIVLILDRSNRMNTTLYQSYYKRIENRPEFENIPANHLTPNRLHDVDNKFNNGVFSTSATVGLINTYKNDKYVEDPNTPGVYIYLSSHYKLINAGTGHCKYYYTFTDSQGNTYKTDEDDTERYYIGSSLLGIKGVGDPLDFPLTFKCEGKEDVKLYAKDFYHRKAGTCVTNEDLISKRNNLYIKDINGGDPIKVNLQIENVHGSNGSNSFTYNKNYVFTFTDSDGNQHRVVQGNAEYGADNGVFQGFKNYRYVTDNNGEKHLEIIHPEDDTSEYKSYESITLYEKTTSLNNISRFEALKEAVEDFLIRVHLDSCYKNTEVRVGIVTYGKDGQTPYHLTPVKNEMDVNKMINNVYRLETDKTFLNLLTSESAQIDLGMQEAYNEFTTYSTGNQKRFAIAFTAGMPTKNYLGKSSREKDYNTTVASNAVYYSYRMKQEKAVNVYSVGMYENAKADETHGSYYFYDVYDPYPCSGNVGSIWGAAALAEINPFKEVDVTDAAAVNRLMNYISSNYLDAQQIGLNRRTAFLNPAGYAITLSYLDGKGYQITKKYEPSDNNHYFAISTRDEEGEEIDGTTVRNDLEDVFSQLAGKMEVAQGELSGQTQLFDVITDTFKLDPDSVDYYTMNYQGGDPTQDSSWTTNDVPVNTSHLLTDLPDNFTPEPINLTVEPAQLSANTKEISLTGFPFSENYIVEEMNTANKAGNYGKKVVLVFDILRDREVIGGNSIPTNEPNSGVYDKDTHLEEHFEIPYVDLGLITSNVTTVDQSIYYSYEADLATLINPIAINGRNNEFVDISYTVSYADPDNPGTTKSITFTVPAGATAPSNEALLERYPQLKQSTVFTVAITVDPEIREPATPETAVTRTTLAAQEANVYVFVPALDVLDESFDVGDPVDLTPTVHNPAWICDLNIDNNSENDVTVSNPTEMAPEITYQIVNQKTPNSPIDKANWHYNIESTEDYQVVNVTIPSRVFTYYVEREVQAKDDDGNAIVDDDNNPVMVIEQEPVEVQRTAEVLNQNKVLFTNLTAPTKKDGSFRKAVSYPFKLHIVKTFSGDMAVAEGVRFTITGSDDSSNSVDIASSSFNGLSGQTVLADEIELKTGTTYTITEGFIASTDAATTAEKDEQYVTTFTPAGFSGEYTTDTVEGETEVRTGEAYTFSVTEEQLGSANSMTLNVANEDLTSFPTVTGVAEDNHASNILLIALAASATISAGGYGMYRVYRTRKE